MRVVFGTRNKMFHESQGGFDMVPDAQSTHVFNFDFGGESASKNTAWKMFT